MPLSYLLHGRAFSPEDIIVISTAFEHTLRSLGLTDRADPATDTVARKIFELATQGERDPVRLRERVVQALTNGRPSAVGA